MTKKKSHMNTRLKACRVGNQMEKESFIVDRCDIDCLKILCFLPRIHCCDAPSQHNGALNPNALLANMISQHGIHRGTKSLHNTSLHTRALQTLYTTQAGFMARGRGH